MGCWSRKSGVRTIVPGASCKATRAKFRGTPHEGQRRKPRASGAPLSKTRARNKKDLKQGIGGGGAARSQKLLSKVASQPRARGIGGRPRCRSALPLIRKSPARRAKGEPEEESGCKTPLGLFQIQRLEAASRETNWIAIAYVCVSDGSQGAQSGNAPPNNQKRQANEPPGCVRRERRGGRKRPTAGALRASRLRNAGVAARPRGMRKRGSRRRPQQRSSHGRREAK